MKKELFFISKVQSVLFFLTAFLAMAITPAFAINQYESMKVGETKTFYFPSEVTSKAGMMYSYNCTTDHINHVEIISYTTTSVTVKALAFTNSQVSIRFDYWWRENNTSKSDTHMVHIDLTDTSTPSSDPDLNPNNYTVDYGCWGTINIEVGETETVYSLWGDIDDSKVRSAVWVVGQVNVPYGFNIIAQSESSCQIKGVREFSGEKLWCLMKYGSNSFRAYYLVNTIKSTKETLTLTATPGGGEVEKGATIYLTASQSDANIYYTLDGKTPTTSSAKYTSSGITIDETCTLKAVAMKSGYNNSAVMTWVFTAIELIKVSIDETNFPDINFRTYLLEQDYGQDAGLTETEIRSITSIDVSNKDINSLKGIEHFTALKNLYCANNQLTTLDVSQNMALSYLSCGNNQLTTLDVSNNTALSSLSCYDNQLTTLDVSNNVALKSLSCSNNQLTVLNMSNNAALESLSCSNNQLTTLDVSNKMKLWYLYCDNNQLITLDISNNTALENLWCSNNQLTALDVSNNTALSSLSCYNNQLAALDVSNNAALTSLQCFSNLLTQLDVSKNTALTWLSCSSNQLTTLDVSKNTALTNFYCSENQLTTLDVSNNTELTGLHCSSNQLTALDVSNNTALSSLACYNNQLTALNVTGYTALSLLYCYDNQLATLDVTGCTALSLLYCYDNQLATLDVTGCTALSSLFCNNNQLTALDVSNNTALSSLSCYNNQLTALDVSNNTALSSLDCNNNQLTALDVSNNTALSSLYCYNNQLTALDVTGCTALSSLSCHNNQLVALDVSNNTALSSLYCYNNQLTALNVTGCVALNAISCYCNQIEGAAMDALIASLPQIDNGSLRVLSDTNEGNLCTKEQVTVANAKGWVAYCYDTASSTWVEYEGSAPAAIGQLATESADANAPVYNLSGQKVIGSLKDKKSVYIINGKKVVFK